MLINTFLNSQPADPPLRQSPAKPRKQRGIRWIDQSLPPGLRGAVPGVEAPERPPTASYNSMRAGPGWVDTTRPGPNQSHHSQETPSPQPQVRTPLMPALPPPSMGTPLLVASPHMRRRRGR